MAPQPPLSDACGVYWLFDLYAREEGMVLWLLSPGGDRRVRAVDPDFAMTVFVDGPARAVDACLGEAERTGVARRAGPGERRDFWTGAPRRLESLHVHGLTAWRGVLGRLAGRHPAVSWYNADLAPEQVYCYEHDIFPIGLCDITVRGGVAERVTPADDRWDTDYPSLPARRAVLSATGSLLGRTPRLASLTLAHDGREVTWEDPEYLLPSFQDALDSIDPDIIATSGGDAFVIPLLLTAADRTGFDLRLDREDPPAPRRLATGGRSYMSYGRVLYSAPDYPLYGRWHLDARNSFMVEQSGLEGLYEVTRLSRLAPQRIGRRSIGTGITSVQLDVAWRDKTLVPWKKTHPEAWKTARQLLNTDRGGIVYAPLTGFYENVVELDFASMYPTIMARFNVSPETVNCACCDNAAVPEIGYTICGKRHGLVSRALGPIVEKRQRYKALRQAARERGDRAAYERYDHRQCALKWMLVCCFGYLGYRNARFGRIEAHEAVSAYSRELLMRAREACEERGWRMLHANVDCVWIEKPGFERAEVGALCQAIDAATGLDIALEGIYRWVAFLPSRQFANRPVPNRYFGCFEDGELKYRGIECRRGDMPHFIKDAQREALETLAASHTKADYTRACRGLLARIDEWEGALWRHEVGLDELAVRCSMSREPGEYRGNGRQALAARQSVKAGLEMHAGQALEYIITDARNADRERRVRLTTLLDAETNYDAAEYIRLLRRAMNTVLWPAGIELDEDKVTPPWGGREKNQPGRQSRQREPEIVDEQLELW